ncbi:MAG: OmpH family outer membrane protein [Bacteroidaceae bacterium]|nr:OmpH family outer membrane protein [Bacteroidaceae bacterium]
MRNIKPLLLTIFAAMCIIMFTQCSGETKVNDTHKNCTINIDSIKGLKIVYVNLDTIMYRYEFALDINKEMISKEARISATLDGKRKKLEEEIADFEYRCNAKLLATEEQFIEERDKIIKKEQEFVKLRDELYMQLESENMARSKELRDSINNYILEHNQTKGYDFILTKIGDNILYANSALDITMEVVEGLNKRYNKK